MHVYPHVYQCQKSKYINFDEIQTVILRRVGEVLSTDDFALVCALPDSSLVEMIETKLKNAKDALEQTIREMNFVVTEGRTGRIPKTVFDLQMRQLDNVLKQRQEQLNQTEYRNVKDRLINMDKVVPIIQLLRGFWNAFGTASVSSNIGDADNGLEALPIDSTSQERFRDMIDILVDKFIIDVDNNVTVELSIPILEDIQREALSCRQLANIPSP